MPVIISEKTLQFAEEIGVDFNDIRPMLDIECGLHSRIPRCCILFFVLARNRPEFLEEYLNAQEAVLGDEGPGYVPCPACLLKKKFVKMRPCECDHQRTVRFERESA